MIDYSRGALIWKASKTYDTKFCKEVKMTVVVDVWLNSLNYIQLNKYLGNKYLSINNSFS